MIKEVNIMGVIYQVNEVDVVDKEELCRGKINYLTNEIRIDRGLVQSAKEQTLMHEILHAVFDLLGLDELNEDESKVQGIATALHQVFTSQAIYMGQYQHSSGATKGGYEMKKAQFRDKNEALTEYTKIVVETDEKDPVTIAEITTEDVKIADGYRARLTPKYD